MTSYPLVSILLTITHTEYQNYFEHFIQSVRSSSYPSNCIELLVRDNGLTQKDKKDFLQKRQYESVKLIGNGANIQYAKGINDVALHAKGTYLYIGNIDTELSIDSLSQLIKTAVRTKAAIVAPVVYQMEKRNEISVMDLPVASLNMLTGHLVHPAISELIHAKGEIEVSWVSGCGFIIRRDTWKKEKGFDERYWIYWEDADLGMRVKKSGQTVLIVPRAKLFHKGSITFQQRNSEKIYYGTRNYGILLMNHLSLIGKVYLSLKLMMVWCKKMLTSLVSNDPIDIAFAKGIKDFFLKRYGKQF